MAKQGPPCAIDLFCVKPLDAAALLEAARACENRILTVETIIRRGLGDAVMEAVGTANVAVHRSRARDPAQAARPSSCSSGSGSAAARSSRRSRNPRRLSRASALADARTRLSMLPSMPAAARPTSTLVLLVRHGVTPTTGRCCRAARGLHLSEDGRTQAEGLVRRLAPDEAAAIYSSPLERARETAAPLAKARGMAVRVEPGLLECDFGAWTGGSLKRLAKKPEWRIVQAHPSGFRFPGGESFLEMQTRASDAVAVASAIARRNRGRSHARPIKAVVTQALGGTSIISAVMIAPASVTAVAFRAEGTTVLTVNSMDGDLVAGGALGERVLRPRRARSLHRRRPGCAGERVFYIQGRQDRRGPSEREGAALRAHPGATVSDRRVEVEGRAQPSARQRREVAVHRVHGSTVVPSARKATGVPTPARS